MGNTTFDLDRRSFLKGLGVLGAGSVAAAGLAGCAPSGGKASSASNASGEAASDAKGSDKWLNYNFMKREAVGEPEETVQADFVIVGGGGSGMAALLQANDLGLNAVLLEKKSQCGGTFAFAAVGFYPNNHYAIEAGKKVDYNDLIKTIMTYNHYIPSYRLLKNYMNEIPETFDWLENMGCEFAALIPGEGQPGPFSLGTCCHYVGGDNEGGTGGGKALIARMIEEAESRGLDMRVNTEAKELVQDESGKVTGVLATDKSGKVIKFEAPAVLISTGGWANNEDMLRELGGLNPERVISPGYDGRDGDGVYMAHKAGAAWARGNGTVMFYGPHLPGPTWGEAVSNGVYQPTLWVDQNAHRFMNEGINNFAEIGNAIRDIKRLIVIQTEADIDRITKEDGLNGYSGQGGSQSPKDVYKDLLQKEIERGNENIFVANSISELAQKTGLPEENLTETMKRYSEVAKAGVDDDFQKDAKYLSSMEEGPYYAFDCYDGFFTTIGGVAIDENIQAIDEDGNPIEGLYVGGCDTGALCGDIYDFTSAPGEQSSWAVNSGRIAAKNVAKQLGK